MAAIAGIFAPQNATNVEKMLKMMEHRERGIIKLHEHPGMTLGIIAKENKTQEAENTIVADRAGDQHYALAGMSNGRFALSRDSVGVVPLYYGRRGDGALCFASEVKGLMMVSADINEFPPGCSYDGEKFARHAEIIERVPRSESPDKIAGMLRFCLANAVQKRIASAEIGCYLSGGLDSSVMAALARPHVKRLQTVAAGIAGAPDLVYAREVADFIESDHQEVVVKLEDMLRVLPAVIWHLESFDALLVRSSIMHYLASQRISQYASEVFSGEGGDELFAGYIYLKTMPREKLPAELVSITKRLHNTALQRVDRCAAAFGLRAHVCFLDTEVVDLALEIPIDLKLHAGIEKWIVREAATGLLPPRVLHRTKAKFWEGAGVRNLLMEYASVKISDNDFTRERVLPNGWVLASKEELFYYRIFQEQFRPLIGFDWMGRTPPAAGEDPKEQ